MSCGPRRPFYLIIDRRSLWRAGNGSRSRDGAAAADQPLWCYQPDDRTGAQGPDQRRPYAYAALRYFNVAGADAKLRSRECAPVSSHLIKIAAETAVGKRLHMYIYGEDYLTPDGTCIRDYIHVSDLAAAHLAALGYLEKRRRQHCR